MGMTQTLSERASVSGESINILSVAVYRNQALYSPSSLYGIVHVNTYATLPCGINNMFSKELFAVIVKAEPSISRLQNSSETTSPSSLRFSEKI